MYNKRSPSSPVGATSFAVALVAALCLTPLACIANDKASSSSFPATARHHIPKVMNAGFISKDIARHLYLENASIKQHGTDAFGGCEKTQNTNDNRLLPSPTIPVTHYKGIPIVGSPYYPVWVKTDQNNNSAYLDRTVRALQVIERETPNTFANMVRLMTQKGGYLIIKNFCPSNGILTLGAFAAISDSDHFVAMISSTMLLMPELFNDYDIAAALVHEIHGHGTAYYNHGSLSEFPAFTAQAEFASAVGDDKFLDANNMNNNIKAKMKLSLSNTGLYLDNAKD